MTTVPGAILPAKPFPFEVPVPETHPSDEPTVQVCVNVDWIPYILGALGALLVDSTWDTQIPLVLDSVKNDVQDLLSLFAVAEVCPVPIQFRVNPGDTVNWQYSNDGGTTWLDGPDTAAHYTPSFIASGSSSGYDLSVNSGETQTAVPTLTAIDPDAIVKDPASTFANLITATAGADGLLIKALATIGVKLVQANGVALALQKVFPGLALATSVLEIVAGTDYSYPLVETVDSI
jgi:hypothetical protein